MPHDPRAAVFDMQQAIERAQRLVRGLSKEEFSGNETVQWAIFSQIIILGEAAGRLDKDYQSRHSDIPWASITGMRHRLVHGYDSVDWERVWRTLIDDLPRLLAQLASLIED